METNTKPPTRMGKPELRDELRLLGYKDDQLLDSEGKSLKRPELLAKLQDHKKGEDALNVLSEIPDDDDIGVEVSQDTKEIDTEEATFLPSGTLISDTETNPDDLQELEPPTPNSPEWTQFVLGKFMEDEVDGKNPRVEGLRRVAGELVGELVEEGCDLIAAPTEENRFRACAKAWGVFLTPNGIQKRFEALADAHSENCFEDYATYLVAMADTRAKGRMYRNALCLRRVVAAEEVSKTMSAAVDIQQGGSIHTSQISIIRLMSDRHNFNISEVLDNLGIKYEMNDQTGDVNLQSLTYVEALATAKNMREMKETKEKS